MLTQQRGAEIGCMRIELDDQWHTYLGEGPSPRDIDHLYRTVGKIGAIDQLYPGQFEDMYRIGGYKMGERAFRYPTEKTPLASARELFEAEITERIAPRLLGPMVVHGELVQGSLALWLPDKRL